MQPYVFGKVVKENQYFVIREGRNAATNQMVNIVDLQASDVSVLRRIQSEVDLQRTLQTHFSCKILEVDLLSDQRHTWTVRLIREHCCSNLGAEIRKRSDRKHPWTDLELSRIASNLIEALTELQVKGAFYSRIDLKSLLMRKNGEVVLGSYDRAGWSTDTSKVYASVERLAVVLAKMARLQFDNEAGRDAGAYLNSVDLTGFPLVQGLIQQMRACHPKNDYLALQLYTSQPKPQPVLSPQSLPSSGFAPPPLSFEAKSRSLLPAIRPVPKVSAPSEKRCAACNSPFSVSNFDPQSLRAEYQRYPSYLDKVCSIVCLDTYIRYTNTQARQPDRCMICAAEYYSDQCEWRAGETNAMKDVVCSLNCLHFAIANIR